MDCNHLFIGTFLPNSCHILLTSLHCEWKPNGFLRILDCASWINNTIVLRIVRFAEILEKSSGDLRKGDYLHASDHLGRFLVYFSCHLSLLLHIPSSSRSISIACPTGWTGQAVCFSSAWRVTKSGVQVHVPGTRRSTTPSSARRQGDRIAYSFRLPPTWKAIRPLRVSAI